MIDCDVVGASEAGSPVRRQHHLDSLMPTTSVGMSLSSEADGLTLCGRWRVHVPRAFRVLQPSQSIDPNSQSSPVYTHISLLSACSPQLNCLDLLVACWRLHVTLADEYLNV